MESAPGIARAADGSDGWLRLPLHIAWITSVPGQCSTLEHRGQPRDYCLGRIKGKAIQYWILISSGVILE
jgi:hypothetical protein